MKKYNLKEEGLLWRRVLKVQFIVSPTQTKWWFIGSFCHSFSSVSLLMLFSSTTTTKLPFKVWTECLKAEKLQLQHQFFFLCVLKFEISLQTYTSYSITKKLKGGRKILQWIMKKEYLNWSHIFLGTKKEKKIPGTFYFSSLSFIFFAAEKM